MVHVVNLPVETLSNVINIDDPRVLVPIEELVAEFSKEKDKIVRSMYATPDLTEKVIKFNTDIAYITQCERKEIVKTNNIRYFKIHMKYFPSEKEFDIILPSYVKLFSRTAKSYVPAEFIRKSDILVDYTGNIVQVFTNEQIFDFEPTEYYSLKLNVNNSKTPITFYVAGIFANVCYNDFNLKEEDLDDDNE